MASQFFADSIFWIETEKISPNPFQPRREFDEKALRDLAESIRMYGLLQPLVVTRSEREKEDGGIVVEYELISGERRLRASKLLGLAQVPAIIRANSESAREKLELAIIENLQREDLNPVERAQSFQKLTEEFGLKHIQVAQKVGKSREYVSNSIRLLALPKDMLDALSQGKISEGHARPLLMLAHRPEEQTTLYKEITVRRMTVREAELMARSIAVEKSRIHKTALNAEMAEMEKKLSESLNTRVQIAQRARGGTISIDFFTEDDLRVLLETIQNKRNAAPAATAAVVTVTDVMEAAPETASPQDDRPAAEKKQEENSEELYSIQNFSL